MQRITDIHGLYHLDLAHSALGFHVRHAGLSRIRGTFDQFQGYALIDCKNVEHSALMVSIATNSINTFVADRDHHLRQSDFLNTAEYPAITFVATSFTILDDTHVAIDGDLTILATTRPIQLVFEWTGSALDPFGNERIGFESRLVISRKEYGLTWNAALETGGWLIGDEVTLEIEASAVKQAAYLTKEGSDVPDDGESQEELLVVVESGGAMRRGILTDDADDPDDRVLASRRAALDEHGLRITKHQVRVQQAGDDGQIPVAESVGGAAPGRGGHESRGNGHGPAALLRRLTRH